MDIIIIWIRRDLRLHDITAFEIASKQGLPVQFIFIFGTNITDDLSNNNALLTLIYNELTKINQTEFMHNRVRMISANFLRKHLLIDWRRGEAYFAQKLFNYELASNNGNWQWAAGTGCDVAPHFRIINPATQAEKFDKNRKYTTKWMPKINSSDYTLPIVDRKFARVRALEN
jgi:deoxyribodipyrimidine photolyase